MISTLFFFFSFSLLLFFVPYKTFFVFYLRILCACVLHVPHPVRTPSASRPHCSWNLFVIVGKGKITTGLKVWLLRLARLIIHADRQMLNCGYNLRGLCRAGKLCLTRIRPLRLRNNDADTNCIGSFTHSPDGP
jgi:hypothetical protein